ncbi:GDSL-like Lipase/Acylhydrolase-domain-containing protein [Chlamydoabsidia padenii]|nr:GDSL-like Lipase/Acylhydrolase-domain-containing protein [Chlamydoabsidia padenii]
MLIQIALIFCFTVKCCLAKVSNIVVFGDSYSDVGNGQLSSNGPLWSQDLAVGWNASLYSFAFSGATCDRTLYHHDKSSTSAPPSIIDQVEMYYNQQLDLVPEDTIYAFWVGYTDIYNMVQANNKDYSALVDCITQQMRNVRKVFETNRFLMFTLAPMENMPYFNNDKTTTMKQQYKKAVDTFNEQLHKKVFNLVGHHQTLELDLVDAHDLLKDMINAPTDFGFKDNSQQQSFWDACQGQCNDSVDEYIWWDKTHLTGGAHRVIANSILISDSLEPSVLLPPADTVDKWIQTHGSRFQSPQYKPHYNTGLINKIIKTLDDAAAAKEEADQHIGKEDLDNTVVLDDNEEDHWIRPLYFGALLTVSLCIGFVIYNKRSKRHGGGNLAALSGLVRNRNSNGRGQFTPLRNLDTPPSEV